MKRVILVGKAASGKDYAKSFFSKALTADVSYTTRPPREGEVDGKDYHFITEDDFLQNISNNEMHEWDNFNGWYYGTTRESFYGSSLFIMTPSGFKKLSREEQMESTVVLFDIDENVRRERMNKRSDADSVERRIAADEADFLNFSYEVPGKLITVCNPLFNCNELLRECLSTIEHGRIDIQFLKDLYTQQ